MDAAHRIQQAIAQASAGLVSRQAVVELLALAAVSRQHLLVLGPPGTAKSELVRRFSQALSATRFEYLLGRFTEPSELFGPVDLVKLREGQLVTRTEGMLPEAELAFLDEVFLGSTAILNTLLGVLAERTFRRGHDVRTVPLRLCVGASNERPESAELAAFADRFALTAYVEPVADSLLEELLTCAAALPTVEPVASVADLDELATQARLVDTVTVRPLYAECVRELRSEGIVLSDRRVVQGQRTIAAAAALSGRTCATAADLWPIVFLVPDALGQERARELLSERLSQSDSSALLSAAELASRSAASRARRIVTDAESLLGAKERGDGWRLRVEGLARDIDAGFAADTCPEALIAVRSRIAELLA